MVNKKDLDKYVNYIFDTMDGNLNKEQQKHFVRVWLESAIVNEIKNHIENNEETDRLKVCIKTALEKLEKVPLQWANGMQKFIYNKDNIRMKNPKLENLAPEDVYEMALIHCDVVFDLLDALEGYGN